MFLKLFVIIHGCLRKGDRRRGSRAGRVACAAPRREKGLSEVLTPESERLSVGRASWSVFGVSLSRPPRVVTVRYILFHYHVRNGETNGFFSFLLLFFFPFLSVFIFIFYFYCDHSPRLLVAHKLRTTAIPKVSNLYCIYLFVLCAFNNYPRLNYHCDFERCGKSIS